jgi:hypothetical protein
LTGGDSGDIVELVLVVLTLPVVELLELVVFTLPVVEFVVDVVLTLVAFYEVELEALVPLAFKTTGTMFLGTWHWHLFVGRTLVDLTLLQSLHVQVVKLEV